MPRVASVWIPAAAGDEVGAGEGKGSGTGGERRSGTAEDGDAPARGDELTAALLAGGPRVMRAGPGLWRVDARGWDRRGGDAALGRVLRDAAARAGFPGARVGVADTFVAGDAAAGWPLEDEVLRVPRSRDSRAARRPRRRRSLRGGSEATASAGARKGEPESRRAGGIPPSGHPAGQRGDDASSGQPGARERNGAPSREGIRVVPPGEDRAFLASLSLVHLPLPEEMRETLGALGFRRIGEVAGWSRSAWEARFGPEGVRLHRWACGEDHRRFRPVETERLPEASVEVDGGGAARSEPLLFLLRHLLARVCGELEERGACAARLRLRLFLDGGGEEEARVSPARPTRQEDMLFDLCRAVLERRALQGGVERRETSGEEARRTSEPEQGDDGTEGAATRVTGLALAVERMAPAGARQGDLFARRWRDPVQAAVVLSRLRARLGEEAVGVPEPRATHRPEERNRWRPAEADAADAGVSVWGDASRGSREGETLRPALRLLPEPVRVGVRTEAGRPAEVRDGQGCREVVASEGPERLSGDWWLDPYRREYYRVCTAGGELLWIFREYRRDGKFRWWLHGWWD